MAGYTFYLTTLLQVLENDTVLAEALFFPEVSCLGEEADELVEALTGNARRVVKDLAPGELSRRHGCEPVENGHVPVLLEPPPGSEAWREPITLSLPVVRWSHATDAHLAFVPALGIEVVAPTMEERERLLPIHIRAAILRTQARALRRLIALERCKDLRVECVPFTVELPTPKQAALEAEEERLRQDSVLADVGLDLTRQSLAPAYEVEDLGRRIAEVLTARNPRSVLLTGPSGVGKTAAFHEMVRQRAEHGLGRTPFWATSGSRLVAGMSGFGMWQERCQKLWREASKKRVILHLGNLIELMEVGKSEYQSQGIATFLRPYLGRGDLLAVAECTPEQVGVIERVDPHLLRAFTVVAVEEPPRERVQAILAQFAVDFPGPTPPPEALAAVDRLHRRYATYSANPGRPLRFLRNLLTDHPRGRSVRVQDVTSAFSRETGLPLFLLEDSERLNLPAARTWFGRRVIGQEEGVELIVDLLATVKAGLSRPRKPIASLLFIGPTGVGKTEMAKALAEFLFGSKDRLTRFDMSEYADPQAVQRLIGGVAGEGVLTAQIREQPFSVVLLDEVEKAHPLLFDLLLQVLGEGRLTDAAGRLADFCNSVVIMTSNLGAETFGQGTFGLAPQREEGRQAREHFLQAVQRFVRPELFNRIDRIVPFSPLDAGTTRRIVERQLGLVQERDGIRHRGVVLGVSEEVADWLANKGHDPRYGARPLKRAIERELLAPLAERMNGYTAETPLRIQVGLKEDCLDVSVRARTDETGRLATTAGGSPVLREMAPACLDLRRDLQGLQQCPAMLELLNEIYRLEKLEKRRDFSYNPHLVALQRVRDAQDDLYRRITTLEDQALLTLYSEPAGDTAVSGEGERLCDELAAGLQKWTELLLALYALGFEKPNEVMVVIFSEQPDLLVSLASAYYALAGRHQGMASVWQFLASREGQEAGSTPEKRLVTHPEQAFGEGAIGVRWFDREKKALLNDEVLVPARNGVLGFGMVIEAEAAYLRFAPELGLHEFRGVKQQGKCLVETSDQPMMAYVPPEGIARRGAIGGQTKRRLYSLERGFVEDLLLNRKFDCSKDGLETVLAETLEQSLLHLAQALIKP
jgi:ATP-dependent Clp protease ATP-binding subunit ClpA